MVQTGGNRTRTVSVVVGIVVGVGGLLAGRAFAEAPSPAAVAAHRQPLVSGTPCTVTARSCVDLPAADAQAWFENLQVGDQVQVVKAGEEHAAREKS